MKKREQKNPKNDILKPSRWCKSVNIALIGFLLLILLITVLSEEPCPFLEFFSCWIKKMFQQANEYAPAKAVIGAVGIGGYAISSISAFKEKRAHGILHAYVLRVFFPYATWFYVLHILFVILGLYACEKVLPLQIGCCLIGVSVCFLHSLVVLLGTEYSPTMNRWWIRRLKKRAISDGYSGLLANDVATHIDTSYRSRSTRSSRLIYAGDQFDLALLTDLVAVEDSAKAQLQEFNDRSELVSGGFKQRLTDALLLSAPYLEEGRTEIMHLDTTVIDQIWKCCAMWESSAFFKGNTHTATALMSYVLSQNDILSEMALLSGLLFCVRNHYLNEEPDDNGWKKSCDCLERWVDSYSLGRHENTYVLKEHVALLSLCLLCWEQHVFSREALEDAKIIEISKQLSVFSGGKIDLIRLKNLDYMNQFVSYAFLLCKMYDEKYRHILLRRRVLFWKRLVFGQVDDLLKDYT